MIRASFQAFYDQFSHETYKQHTSTVTCSESKWKNPPGQNDHSRQKQTTRWKYFFVSIIILGHEYTGSASLVAYCLKTPFFAISAKGDVTLVNLQRRFATHVFRTNLQTCYTFESLSKNSKALQHCKYRPLRAVILEWFFAQHRIIASWRCKLTSVTPP